jgi:large subunit ribosomal protein L3
MFMLGRKMKMTQVWKDDKIVPVTVISAEPNTVTIVRNSERDGYEALQLKMGKKARKEFRRKPGEEAISLNMGDTVEVSAFKEGDTVNVRGIMKGRGFQGVVKRHNFSGGPKTHGQKNRLRAPGSIGSTAPQRVWPGRRMAGRMGGTTVTIKNLEVVAVDSEKRTLMVKGAVPGFTGSVLEIRVAPTTKKRNAK